MDPLTEEMRQRLPYPTTDDHERRAILASSNVPFAHLVVLSPGPLDVAARAAVCAMAFLCLNPPAEYWDCRNETLYIDKIKWRGVMLRSGQPLILEDIRFVGPRFRVNDSLRAIAQFLEQETDAELVRLRRALLAEAAEADKRG